MSTTDFAHTIGSRYTETSDLDIADIAKLVRKDIKAAVKTGLLPADVKYGVRIERYSLGQSINVRATLPDRPARVQDDYAYPGHYGYTTEATQIMAVLRRIVESFNYDNSDMLSDYFSQRFFAHVNVDGTRES